MMAIRVLKLFLVVSVISCFGCSPVAPWQSGNLAKAEMAINPNPNVTHIREHVYTSREASQGGGFSAGGGCGCN